MIIAVTLDLLQAYTLWFRQDNHGIDPWVGSLSHLPRIPIQYIKYYSRFLGTKWKKGMLLFIVFQHFFGIKMLIQAPFEWDSRTSNLWTECGKSNACFIQKLMLIYLGVTRICCYMRGAMATTEYQFVDRTINIYKQSTTTQARKEPSNRTSTADWLLFD